MDVIREMFLNNCPEKSKEDEHCPEKSKEDEQEVPDDDLLEEKNKGATSNGKEGVSLGNHYMVFMVQTWTDNGAAPSSFVVSRYCLDSLNARWVRANVMQITAALAVFGFVVNHNGFDGASENRSAVKMNLTLTPRDLISDLLESESETDDAGNCEMVLASEETSQVAEDDASPVTVTRTVECPFAGRLQTFSKHDPSSPRPKYKKDELPWDMPVAYYHPTVRKSVIAAGGDAPHGIKKEANGMENSGIPTSPRDLHLNGLPVQLRMGADAWAQCPDAKESGDFMVYPKLSREVFEKNAKSRMRVGLAARAQGGSIVKCIQNYGHKNSKAGNSLVPYRSYILHSQYTDHFFDVMNGDRDSGCENINARDHRHVFDLLNYVRFHHLWRSQARNAVDFNFYFPESTYEDICWTSIGIVLVARLQLPAETTMIQRHHGSDHLEETFRAARNANSGATAKDTDSILARQRSEALLALIRGRKANGDARKRFNVSELGCLKQKRTRLVRAGKRKRD